CQHSRELPFTF
nr:immunoglobulin light chain junction region [Mus musculus]NSL99155.1 immunoglobulin light chain junction region [Mus musculus]